MIACYVSVMKCLLSLLDNFTVTFGAKYVKYIKCPPNSIPQRGKKQSPKPLPKERTQS